jgi:membrane associated rhomboid family serine protease
MKRRGCLNGRFCLFHAPLTLLFLLAAVRAAANLAGYMPIDAILDMLAAGIKGWIFALLGYTTLRFSRLLKAAQTGVQRPLNILPT